MKKEEVLKKLQECIIRVSICETQEMNQIVLGDNNILLDDVNDVILIGDNILLMNLLTDTVEVQETKIFTKEK